MPLSTRRLPNSENFKSKTKDLADERSLKWLSNSYFKKETEGLLFGAQEQAPTTNAIRANIDKQLLQM